MKLPWSSNGRDDHQPIAEHSACAGDAPTGTAQTGFGTGELAHPAPTRAKEPLTEQILMELARSLLLDIQAWQARHGYTAVPPIEILRQVTQIAETIGSSRKRSSRD